MRTISGATKFVALLGHPVGQVRSPGPINDWFQANATDAVLVPVDIEGDRVPAFVDALRGIDNCIGLSVTVPHKQRVAALVDELTDRARVIGAVNIVRRLPGGKLLGDMVDGIAMADALSANGLKLRGSNAVVIGAGGAGMAILHALGQAGVASLALLEIDETRRDAAIASLSQRFPELALSDELPAGLEIDVVINASPLGMLASDPFPLSLDRLGGAKVVADVVTKPAVTPWLQAARANGYRIQAGEEMTLAQIGLQLRFWGFPFK